MCIRELKNKSGTGMRISEQNIRNHTEKSKWKFYRIETFTKRSIVKRLKKYCNIIDLAYFFSHGEIALLLKGRKSADTYVRGNAVYACFKSNGW